MCVVSHGYGRLDGAGMEVVIGKHVVQNQEGLVTCQEIQEHSLSDPCSRLAILNGVPRMLSCC